MEETPNRWDGALFAIAFLVPACLLIYGGVAVGGSLGLLLIIAGAVLAAVALIGLAGVVAPHAVMSYMKRENERTELREQREQFEKQRDQFLKEMASRLRND